MHQLMESKGFRRKTPQDRMDIIKAARLEEQIKKIEQFASGQSFFGGMISVYGMVLFAGVGTCSTQWVEHPAFD